MVLEVAVFRKCSFFAALIFKAITLPLSQVR